MVFNLSPPAVVGFLGRDCHYKSVAAEIHQDAGLAPIPYNGPKFLPIRDRTSAASCTTSSKQYALNLAGGYGAATLIRLIFKITMLI